MRTLLLTLGLWGAAAAAPGSALARAGDGTPPDLFQVRLLSRQFTPEPGYPALGRGALLADGALSGPRHVLLQPRDPRDAAWRERVKAAGIDLLQYVPNNTWIASIPSGLDPRSSVLRELRWMGLLAAEDRVSPSLLRQGAGAWAVAADGRVRLRVTFFADVPASRAVLVLREAGAEVLGLPGRFRTATVLADPAAVARLAAREEVCWVIEAPPEPVPLNDGLRANVHADTLAQAPYCLSGAGAKAGVWDSGEIDATHGDLVGRVTVVDHVGVSGHATHVAGVLGGDGTLSSARGGTPFQWRGVAPEAAFYSFSYLHTPVEEHDAAINTYGIDLSQNSWGYFISSGAGNCSYYGDYVWDAPEFDAIVTGIFGRPVPVVFAVGNERDDGDCGIPARGGYACIAPPATAKNVITVGAIESDTDGMTPFSSWGPTDDGRIRPDLVAPGCEVGGDHAITSTEPGGLYGPRCGTSQSAPAVSGTIALLVEQARRTAPGQPMLRPASLKALLIEGARDLGQPGPDFANGWGALDAWNTMDRLRTEWVIEREVSDLAAVEIPFTVPPGDSSLRVTLAWDDPAALEGANPALVNDLDLVLVDPSLGVHQPYVLHPASPASPATTGVDSVNNVEQVEVASPEPGVWICRVTGAAVPEGPQAFSVAGVDLCAPAAASGLAVAAIEDSTVHVRWVNAEDLDLGGTLVVRSASPSLWIPEQGTAYAPDEEVEPGVFVICAADGDHSVDPLVDGPLSPGSVAHYRVFSYDTHWNYAAAVEESVVVGNAVPEVVEIAPAPRSLGVAADVSPAFTFNVPVDSTSLDSVSVRVTGRVSGLHWGAVSLAAGKRVVVLDPAADFAPGETVEIVLGPAIRAYYGQPMGTGYSFTFTVAVSGTGQGEFAPGAAIALGPAPSAVRLADLDRDGDPDGLVGDASAGTLAVLRNEAGSLTLDATYGVGSGASLVEAADVDGDGAVDVLVGRAAGDLLVLHNAGDGTLVADSAYALGGSPGGMAVADLDRDGHVDVAVTVECTSDLAVLRNRGDGSFTVSHMAVSAAPRGVAAGDVDGDGDTDLALALSAAERVRIYLNQGDGTFAAGWFGVVGGQPSDVELADLDGDSDLDLAILRRSAGEVLILRNGGHGNFGGAPPRIYAVGALPWTLVAADADGDDDLDLMVTVRGDSVVSLLRNLGGAQFQAPVTWETGGDCAGLDAANLVADGDVDLLVAVPGSGGVVPYLNTNPTSSVGPIPEPPLPALELEGVRPNPFRPGNAVISFSLDRPRVVEVAVFDVTGRQVATLVDGFRDAGRHESRWDARDRGGNVVSPGIYFVRLRAGDQVISRKVVLSP